MLAQNSDVWGLAKIYYLGSKFFSKFMLMGFSAQILGLAQVFSESCHASVGLKKNWAS